jgi:hypothetical protein
MVIASPLSKSKRLFSPGSVTRMKLPFEPSKRAALSPSNAHCAAGTGSAANEALAKTKRDNTDFFMRNRVENTEEKRGFTSSPA